MSVASVTTVAELEALQGGDGADKLVVVFFWADFHEPSRSGGQMDKLFSTLAANTPGAIFARAPAEDADDLADQFDVSAVPTFVFLRGKALLEKLQGADPAKLAELVAKHATRKAAAFAPTGVSKKAALEARLRKLVSTEHVMLFMKGNPEGPRCKFSRAMVELLKEQAPGMSYGSFDILSDDDVRQGLKDFAQWPTYPQLWVGGKLLGGLDIAKELAEDGELKEALAPRTPAPAAPSSAGAGAGSGAPEPASKEVLEPIINRERVMLFMKGSPDAPRCGFSSKMVDILKGVPGLKYGTFDILTDQAVRAGLKLHYDWPTFPQLYVDGELKGGLDVVKGLQEDGELSAELGL